MGACRSLYPGVFLLPSDRRFFLQRAAAFTLVSGSPRIFAQQTMHDMGSMTVVSGQTPAGQSVAAAPPPLLRAATLAPFVDPLPLPKRIHGGHAIVRIAMREVYTKVHRDVPETRMWVYTDAADRAPGSLSPLIEARSHHPLKVEWMNQLPTKHFLPVDFSLHGCGRELPEVRTVAHLHGAKVPSSDDGYPTDWFASGKSRTCTYPLEQDATALWFHDHAMGLNRLNSYAGLAGMLLVRDGEEDRLHLPSGEYELPLIIADRVIDKQGQLYYPVSGDPDHPWVPEFYGDSVLINGKIKPYVEVEPRLYRLRILNAANSQFFALGLSNKQPLHVIGCDQGLLSQPEAVPMFLLAPAERMDVLVDFAQCAGQQIQLRTGFQDLMQFRVSSVAAKAPVTTVPQTLRPFEVIPESSATVTRTITLNEIRDGRQNPMVMLLNHKRWHEPVTETPKLGSTEIWEFVNLTEDTHPMHMHLVRFQVLDRRTFEPFAYETSKERKYLAAAMPPERVERGWKDVVQCHPGMITRIIVKFDGYAGKYLYHCHVLEHEANDMMRPFEVMAT